MSANILFISPKMLKERSTVHENLDDKFISPEIKVCQDMYILPILGTALFEKISSMITAQTINDSPNANYKGLLDTYIVDALMYYTIANIGLTVGMQIWNKGVVRKQGESTQLPSMSEMYDLQNRNLNRAEFYGNKLKLYLIASTAATPPKFPEYLLPGTSLDTVVPSANQFTMPVFLGDSEKGNPWCNEMGFVPRQPYKD